MSLVGSLKFEKVQSKTFVWVVLHDYSSNAKNQIFFEIFIIPFFQIFIEHCVPHYNLHTRQHRLLSESLKKLELCLLWVCPWWIRRKMSNPLVNTQFRALLVFLFWANLPHFENTGGMTLYTSLKKVFIIFLRRHT